MIIDGRKISSEILEQLQKEVASLSFRPKLIDVLVGEDPVTESYVRIKAKRAAEIGIDFETVRLPANISEEDLENKVRNLNLTPHLCGMIIQLPLPEHLDKQKIIDAIDPYVDVDVITTENSDAFYESRPSMTPPTAGAIMRILESLNLNLKGEKVLVVGAGDLVGKPVTPLLEKAGADVKIADLYTTNIAELAQQANIIISGTGVPNLINKDMVHADSIVIDAGTAESAGGISGDADFNAIKDTVAAISPVPGGVGPVTVAMLLRNVVLVAKGSK